jgi:hypothetical protein
MVFKSICNGFAIHLNSISDMVRGMETEQAGEVSAKLGRIDRSSPLSIHREGQISENPFEGQKVWIQLKAKVLFEGVECTTLPPLDYESTGATIHKWLPQGIMIDGGYYIPNANIVCISPYQTREEILGMRESKGLKTII